MDQLTPFDPQGHHHLDQSILDVANLLDGKSDLCQDLTSLVGKFRILKGVRMGNLYDPQLRVFCYLHLPTDLPKEFQHHQGHWEIYHDGTAESCVWNHRQEEDGSFKLLGVIQYGCVHNYREISVDECTKRGITHFGSFWHVNVCKNCGHVNAYDSSG